MRPRSAPSQPGRARPPPPHSHATRQCPARGRRSWPARQHRTPRHQSLASRGGQPVGHRRTLPRRRREMARDLRPQQRAPAARRAGADRPALIEPGWMLRLPPAPAPRPPPGPATPGPRPAPRPPARPRRHRTARTRPPAARRTSTAMSTGAGLSLPSGGLAGVGLAAAVAAALVSPRSTGGAVPARQALTSSLEPAGPPVPPAIAVLRRAAAPPARPPQTRGATRTRPAGPARRPGTPPPGRTRPIPGGRPAGTTGLRPAGPAPAGRAARRDHSRECATAARSAWTSPPSAGSA